MQLTLQQIFADRVIDARKKQSLTQEDLATLSGLDRTYISGIERARRNATLKTVESIAKALATPAYELLMENKA